jgi:sulfate transport system ATP-binding protein
LELRKVPPSEIRDRVEQLLDLVQLSGYGNRYPSQLSGGQRQRIALARALSVQPQILLLDEPFGALDAKVRKELRAWLHRLHREVNVTTVFVTHDQEEAMEVADQVVVMNRGKIEQVGTPAELYDQPASSFVMSFIGPVNVLSIFPGSIAKWAGDRIWNDRDDLHLFLRPHDIEIATAPDEDSLPATVDRVVHLGWEVQVQLKLQDGPSVTAHMNRDRYHQLKIDRQQQVYARPRNVRVFPLQA